MFTFDKLSFVSYERVTDIRSYLAQLRQFECAAAMMSHYIIKSYETESKVKVKDFFKFQHFMYFYSFIWT